MCEPDDPREGTVTAHLAGPPGSGKSTRRHWSCAADPTAGLSASEGSTCAISPPTRLFTGTSLRPLQDPSLDISVRDNTRFGVPGASEEAVWAAAGAAQPTDYLRPAPRPRQRHRGGRSSSAVRHNASRSRVPSSSMRPSCSRRSHRLHRPEAEAVIFRRPHPPRAGKDGDVNTAPCRSRVSTDRHP